MSTDSFKKFDYDSQGKNERLLRQMHKEEIFLLLVEGIDKLYKEKIINSFS